MSNRQPVAHALGSDRFANQFLSGIIAEVQNEKAEDFCRNPQLLLFAEYIGQGSGTSPLVPQFCVRVALLEFCIIYQTPSAGRKTAKSLLPSPS